MFIRKEHFKIMKAQIGRLQLENERFRKELKRKEVAINELSKHIRDNITICTNCSNDYNDCGKL